MKKIVLLVAFFILLAIGSIITTYVYVGMQDQMTYKNSLFVSKEVSRFYG